MGNNLTNSPNGLSSFGIPVIPQGIPYGKDSKVFYVDARYGLDGQVGSIERPFKTLAKALASARADKNDVVFFIATSNSGGTTSDLQTAALDWNKNLVHLVGICAPTVVSQRARIGNAAASALAVVMTISAAGCVISNLQIINEIADATALIASTVTGERNYFKNVHFAGVVNATQSAAGSASLKIDGGAENIFEDCTIGVDTSSYDADATGLLFDSGATRNIFRRCRFTGFLTAAGYAHVTVADSAGIDRWQIFEDCLFIAESVNSTITQTEVFAIPAITQGKIILKNSTAFSDGGAVVWDSNSRGIIWNDRVAAAATAAGGIMTTL